MSLDLNRVGGGYSCEYCSVRSDNILVSSQSATLAPLLAPYSYNALRQSRVKKPRNAAKFERRNALRLLRPNGVSVPGRKRDFTGGGSGREY